MICRFCRGDIIGRGFNFQRTLLLLLLLLLLPLLVHPDLSGPIKSDLHFLPPPPPPSLSRPAAV